MVVVMKMNRNIFRVCAIDKRFKSQQYNKKIVGKIKARRRKKMKRSRQWSRNSKSRLKKKLSKNYNNDTLLFR